MIRDRVFLTGLLSDASNFQHQFALKASSRSGYSTMNRHWLVFLAIARVRNTKGVLDMAVSTHECALLLIAFMHWCFRDKEFSVTTYRGRLSAAISLQRHNFLDIGSLRLVWKSLKAYEAKHVPAEKFWLSLDQMRKFFAGIWRHAIKDPTVIPLVLVAEAMCEPVLREGNLIATSRSATDFDWRSVTISENAVSARLIEKVSRAPIRTVKCLVWPKRSVRRGFFGAVKRYLLLHGAEAGGLQGPILAGDGKPLSQPMFVSWMKEIGVRLGLTFPLLPRVLRRSAIKLLAKAVPKRQLRFMVGHISDSTASLFYDGLDEEETAAILSQMHDHWDPFEEKEEKTTVRAQRTLPSFIPARTRYSQSSPSPFLCQPRARSHHQRDSSRPLRRTSGTRYSVSFGHGKSSGG